MNCATQYCLNDAVNGRYCHKCVSRKWRKKHPIRATYKTLKSNAKRRGAGFILTLIEFTKFCLQTNYINLKGVGANDMTVGRKDHYMPYAADNIVMETKRENCAKGKTGKKPEYKPDGVPF